MKQLFEEVKTLIAIDDQPIEFHLCKLTEEVGELAQGVNKLLGRKTIKETETLQSITENIAEEICDNIQILFAIANKAGITYENLLQTFIEKNNDYRRFINNK